MDKQATKPARCFISDPLAIGGRMKQGFGPPAYWNTGLYQLALLILVFPENL